MHRLSGYRFGFRSEDRKEGAVVPQDLVPIMERSQGKGRGAAGYRCW